MSVVRIFGRGAARQDPLKSTVVYPVNAASVSWPVVLQASADEPAHRTKRWHKFRFWRPSSALPRSGESFEGPGQLPLWSHLLPFGQRPPSRLAFRLGFPHRDELAQGGQWLPGPRIVHRRIHRAPDNVSSPGWPSLLAWSGASRGLGFEFASQYAAEGWRVFAACRNPAAATKLQHLAQDKEGVLKVIAMDAESVREAAG